MGIRCEEWERACAELSSHDTVALLITDIEQTGILVLCDYIKARFPGGTDSLNAFIDDHLRYPDSIMDKSLTGSLNLNFAIDTNGRVDKIIFNKPVLGLAFKEECRRLLKLMPKWQPATCDQRKVQSSDHRIKFLFKSA
ncbi:MAG: energy transducer TonB [Flavobacteriales bacterium]|nr:energy transducer TonB [Flavobacteriales bacterium]